MRSGTRMELRRVLLGVHVVKGVDPTEHRLFFVVEELILVVESFVHVLKRDLVAL